MNESELLELKEKIEESKSKLSEYKGRLQGLMDELNTKWSCNTLKQVEKLRDEKLQEQENLQKQIDEGLEKLEEELENQNIET